MLFKKPKLNNNLTTAVLKIGGMHCASCALNIDFELEDLPGVTEVKTNYAKGESEIVFDPNKVAKTQILEVIGKLGYEVMLDDKEKSAKII